MVNFFKNFGKGVLYVLVLPFLLVGLALYGVGALFVFIFLAFKGLILFFTGRSLYEDLPEDIEAKKRLNGNKEENQSVTITPTVAPAANEEEQKPSDVNTADPFYVPEYLKNEESQEEPEFAEEEVQPEVSDVAEEDSYQTIEEEPIDMQNETISIQKNPQNSRILDISDEDDDDDDNHNSGVTINFD